MTGYKIIKPKVSIILAVLLFAWLPLNLLAYESPYNNPAFRSVLNNVKLQHPNEKIRIGYGRFKDNAKPYFFLEKSRYMTFKAEKQQGGAIVRSELRMGPKDWDVDTARAQILNAELHLSKPATLNQITLLQIHAVKPSYPPLRIVWLRKHKNIKDHIWALVRPSPYNSRLNYIDLGKREGKRFTHYSIRVQNSNLQISVNGRFILKQSLEQWKGTFNYYKAGLYLSGKNDGGKAKVRFKSLAYKF